jgi:ATP-dependent helicase HrpA
MDRLGPILQLRQQVQQRIGAVAVPALPGSRTLSSLTQLGAPAASARSRITHHASLPHPLAEELATLVSPRFLERIAYDRLTHLPRYLKALLIRAERAALNPAKDRDRLRQLAPYQDALKALQAQPAGSAAAQRQIESFRWMVEEFKVSLFAQEVGTAVPVSPKRLDQQLEFVRQAS